MAHFAQFDENNLVIQVIVVHNNELLDADGNESEEKGIEFCQSLFGSTTRWVQTSYNGNIRKHYAAIGFTFDEVRDAFVPPKPFASWVLNEALVLWEAPIPYPEEGNYLFKWDEDTLCWIETDIPKRT
jgi:hypothetical protein